MQNHTGVYDSVEESKFHSRNVWLKPAQNTYYPETFRDSDGITFKAKPDFIFQDQIYVEYKSRQLNYKPTKSKAEEDYKGQLYRMNKWNKNDIQLKHQWHHSVYKQGIVARKYSDRFLLVFKDKTELKPQARNKLIEQQVPWCYESEMTDRLLQMIGSNTLH